jgi:hypothetical protein
LIEVTNVKKRTVKNDLADCIFILQTKFHVPALPFLLLTFQIEHFSTESSVADPVPDPPDPDPRVVALWDLLDPDPDPLVRGIRILLSLSKNSKKNLDFYCFVTSFLLFSFEK